MRLCRQSTTLLKITMHSAHNTAYKIDVGECMVTLIEI